MSTGSGSGSSGTDSLPGEGRRERLARSRASADEEKDRRRPPRGTTAGATAQCSFGAIRIPGSGSFMRRVEVDARRAKKRAAAGREWIRSGGDGPVGFHAASGYPDRGASCAGVDETHRPSASEQKGPPPTASWEIPIAAATARPSHPLGSFPSCSVPGSGELHARRRGSRRSPLSR